MAIGGLKIEFGALRINDTSKMADLTILILEINKLIVETIINTNYIPHFRL